MFKHGLSTKERLKHSSIIEPKIYFGLPILKILPKKTPKNIQKNRTQDYKELGDKISFLWQDFLINRYIKIEPRKLQFKASIRKNFGGVQPK